MSRFDRGIRLYKMVALVRGVNMVRRELRLEKAPVPAADPRFSMIPSE